MAAPDQEAELLAMLAALRQVVAERQGRAAELANLEPEGEA